MERHFTVGRAVLHAAVLGNSLISAAAQRFVANVTGSPFSLAAPHSRSSTRSVLFAGFFRRRKYSASGTVAQTRQFLRHAGRNIVEGPGQVS